MLDSTLLVLFTFAMSLNFAGSRIVCLIVPPLLLTHTKQDKIWELCAQKLKYNS